MRLAVPRVRPGLSGPGGGFSGVGGWGGFGAGVDSGMGYRGEIRG